MRTGALGVALFASLIALGCTVSPQPEPPAVDITRMSLVESGDREVRLVGAAGSVAPGGSDVTVLNLDGKAPAAHGVARGDGSFDLGLEGALDDEFRLQATRNGAGSSLVDVTGVAGLRNPPVALAHRPLDGCFSFEGGLELGPLTPGSHAIAMANECGGPVIVGSYGLRLGSAWDVDGQPLNVPADGTGAFDVRFAPSEGGSADDVVFIEIVAPEEGRRAISLKGDRH